MDSIEYELTVMDYAGNICLEQTFPKTEGGKDFYDAIYHARDYIPYNDDVTFDVWQVNVDVVFKEDGIEYDRYTVLSYIRPVDA